MKDISQHCSDLSFLLGNYEPHEFENTCEWLAVASGIVEVKYDSFRFDKSFGWCSGADKFNSSREVILEKVITELTRFTYVWGSLESIIEEIAPPPSPERGKINSICFYLKNNLVSQNKVHLYSELINDLKTILLRPEVNEPKTLNRFNGTENISIHGLGIYVIYKLRNQFSHGAFRFPYPDYDNKPNSIYPCLISTSTRIILLSIQMILLAYYKNSSIMIEEFINNHQRPISDVLKQIHLKEFDIWKC